MKILFLFALIVLACVFSINDAFAFKTISNDSTGGDCSTIGIWNSATKTCTLNRDISEDIRIYANGITLDGNGHVLDSGIIPSGSGGVLISGTDDTVAISID